MISVFVGCKVSVTLFEVGARVYWIGPRGSVVASDHARGNCELRVTSRSSTEGYGNDADRVEFRFRQQPDGSVGERPCQGRGSRSTLVNNAPAARVEGPDHARQFAR